VQLHPIVTAAFNSGIPAGSYYLDDVKLRASYGHCPKSVSDESSGDYLTCQNTSTGNPTNGDIALTCELGSEKFVINSDGSVNIQGVIGEDGSVTVTSDSASAYTEYKSSAEVAYVGINSLGDFSIANSAANVGSTTSWLHINGDIGAVTDGTVTIPGKLAIGAVASTYPLEVAGSAKINGGTLVLDSCDPSNGATCNTGSIEVKNGPLFINSSGWGTYFNIDTDAQSDDNYTFYSDCAFGSCTASDIVARFNGVYLGNCVTNTLTACSDNTDCPAGDSCDNLLSKNIYFPGSLGVGVSTPDFKLHIKENTHLQLAFDRTGYGNVNSQYIFGPSFTATNEWLGLHTSSLTNAIQFEQYGAVGIHAGDFGGFGEQNNGNFTLGKLVVADNAGGILALGRNDNAADVADLLGAINFVSDDTDLCGGASVGTLCNAASSDGEVEGQIMVAIEARVSSEANEYIRGNRKIAELAFKLRGAGIDEQSFTELMILDGDEDEDAVTINGNLNVNGVITSSGVGVGSPRQFQFSWYPAPTATNSYIALYGPTSFNQGVNRFSKASIRSPGGITINELCCVCSDEDLTGTCGVDLRKSSIALDDSGVWPVWLGGDTSVVSVAANSIDGPPGPLPNASFEFCSSDANTIISADELLAVRVTSATLGSGGCGFKYCRCTVDYVFN